MCGIAGIIDSRGGVSADTVVAMRDTLTHRGPDDAGVWVAPDGRAGLGHRRLSILDLSARGHQPMADPDGRAAIVYNGEVYNFRAIRADLAGRGHAFVSDTDTEVILRAYLEWGIDCADRLEGMFAFAVYDRRDGSAWLVRDRLGIKPLFYAVIDGALVFGSEIRAVRASGRVDNALRVEAAWEYFTTGYVPCPQTIYRNIAKLPPAHRLRFADGSATVENWWQPRPDSLGDGPERAAAKLREHVARAVDDYLVSDVPVGCYLSGGLDSTVVTHLAAGAYARPDAAAARIGGTKLRSFSIGFDVEEHTELPYARIAAEANRTEHHERIVTREMAHATSDDVLDLFDEPFAASSTIPMLAVAELAREHCTVALCGEGGDEAFGGYSWYRTWRKMRRPSFWATPAGQWTRRVLEGLLRRSKRKWRLPAMEDVELYSQLMGAVAAADKEAIFSGDVVSSMAGTDPAGPFRRWWRDDLPPMTRMQYVDLMTFLPDLNLTRADRTSMRVSLELRVPLLHHELIEYALGLGEDVRNPDGRLKGLFKTSCGDCLPESIRHRRKKGFSAPVKHWFTADDLTRLARDVRAEKPALAAQWLRADLERTCRRFQGSRAYKLWVFLNWLRRHG